MCCRRGCSSLQVRPRVNYKMEWSCSGLDTHSLAIMKSHISHWLVVINNHENRLHKSTHLFRLNGEICERSSQIVLSMKNPECVSSMSAVANEWKMQISARNRKSTLCRRLHPTANPQNRSQCRLRKFLHHHLAVYYIPAILPITNGGEKRMNWIVLRILWC